MPVRDKAVFVLSSKRALSEGYEEVIWVNGCSSAIAWKTDNPDYEDLLQDLVDAAESDYLDIVHAVDWQRVLIQAMGAHGGVDCIVGPGNSVFGDTHCGSCVEAALMFTHRRND